MNAPYVPQTHYRQDWPNGPRLLCRPKHVPARPVAITVDQQAVTCGNCTKLLQTYAVVTP